jgi:uncharacterized protein involved in exopolysaccharide biosynthesis
MAAKTAEQNEAAMAQLREELRTGLGSLPQLVVQSLAGDDTELNSLIGLPAQLRTELNRELDRLERVAQNLARLQHIEQHRREAAE